MTEIEIITELMITLKSCHTALQTYGAHPVIDIRVQDAIELTKLYLADK